MKVLHLINYAGNGGSENYVYKLINEQISRGINALLVYGVSGSLTDRVDALGVKTLRVEMKHPFDRAAAKQICDICVAEKVTSIHAHFPRENCIACAVKQKLPGLRIIFTAHLVLPCGKAHVLINRYFSKYDDAVIAVCSAQKPVLEKNGYPSEKIRIIPNGVGTFQLTESEKDTLKKAMKQKLSIPDHVYIAGTLTRYEPVKGLPLMLNAAFRLKEISALDFRFVIVGDGTQYDEIQKQIHDLKLEKNIICIPRTDDVKPYLCLFDIYMNTSQSEALSFAIIEAMSAGLPIIATHVGGNVDIIDEVSRCGFTVEYGDADGLAEKTDKLLCDDTLRLSMGRNAKKRASDFFSVSRMMESTMSLYL